MVGIAAAPAALVVVQEVVVMLTDSASYKLPLHFLSALYSYTLKIHSLLHRKLNSHYKVSVVTNH